jgi:hypothetical protein
MSSLAASLKHSSFVLANDALLLCPPFRKSELSSYPVEGDRDEEALQWQAEQKDS